ncbi:MAG: App1 family protein [Myxococcota bacterium]
MPRSKAVTSSLRLPSWVLAVSVVGLGCANGEPESPAPASPPPMPEYELAQVDPSTLASDEVVRFLPTFGVLRGSTWDIPIEAWVFEPEYDSLSRRVVLELFGDAISVPDGWSADAKVRARLQPFVVDNERGEYLALRRGPHAARVGPTTPSGRARGAFELPVDTPVPHGERSWVELEVVVREGDTRRFSAWAQLLADEGVSVISDVDDTIKVTEVHDRKAMFENTFLRDPVAVPKMAAVYERWAEQDVAFHYVSASPLPLLDAMAEFARDEGFPRGSFALRPFRWRAGEMIDLLAPSEAYKKTTIATIIRSFSTRQFVLIGDTGEHDPEIYAAIARQFPGRVRSVYLRDPRPGGTPGLQARLDAAFEGLDAVPRHVIRDGADLPESP